jgi:hypothetical protein
MDSDTVEEIKRHFGIIAEGLRSDVRAVAEGQELLATKVDALDRKVDGLDRKVDGLAQIVHLTYSEVSGRLNDHETRLGALEHRKP